MTLTLSKASSIDRDSIPDIAKQLLDRVNANSQHFGLGHEVETLNTLAHKEEWREWQYFQFDTFFKYIKRKIASWN